MGKLVYVGYENHGALVLAMTGCDVFFSGNYLNTRYFQQAAFVEDSANYGRRALWYYAPQTLSEYRLNSLDLARNQNKLGLLAPYKNDIYAQVLFNPNAVPSDTAYSDNNTWGFGLSQF